MTAATQQTAPDWFVYQPGPALSGLVQDIIGYRERGQPLVDQVEVANLIFPLIISFGDPFNIALGQRPATSDHWGSFAAGLYAGPVFINSNGQARCIQINFTAAGAKGFFGLPLSELADRMVTLEELGDQEILTLRQRLFNSQDWNERFVLVEHFVLQRLQQAAPERNLAQVAYGEILKQSGNLRISALAQKLDCSRKHLARCFRIEFGLSPKTVTRVVRFKHALDLAGIPRARPERDPVTAPDWADIAFASGYADQAHFCREFADLSGSTPSGWLAKTK
ncbi:AraC family transcriptional regulator [Kiloniella laminariae]|uniref:AraC family transcriptional regulator n=1 Tax=Kiloniella laminariae TaxID=454162 RepID=UPI000382A366|nr:helix-turn-helix domain-containing protein [Kiloniella laminariae]